ncbi:MAG TPA: hypothetical protein VF654_14945 [Pyrinomonadaceae bacterium]
MKRTLPRPLALLLALAACASASASAQEQPCRLERAVAPDYGGVMLGMTAAELARMFPGSDELRRAQADGTAAGSEPVVASLGMLELGLRREAFADAAEVALTFAGGRLRRVDVYFRRPAPWKNVAEFSAQASKRLAVPANAWGEAASDAERQARALDCRGFSVVVRVDRDGPSTLSIVDTAAAAAPATTDATTTTTKTPPAKRRPRRPARKP